MMKFSKLILVELLLLQCLSHLSISEGYDFFYFVQMWPGSYCDTKKSCCYPTPGKPATNFTIHGLWPHFMNNTSPANCNRKSPYDGTKTSDLFSRMQVSWATLACPKNNGTKFWMIKDIKDKVNLFKILETAGIRPDDKFYTVDDMKAAIKAGTGVTAAVECNSDPSRNNQLYQVYMCVDASGKDLIECPVIPIRKCNPSIQFPVF